MAHSAFKISTLAILSVLTVLPASSQNYNYRIGNTRVVQGAGGLANPSASYITGGTLSHSAQVGAGVANPYGPSAGLTAGVSGATGLQSARMGSTVGVAGDYMRSDLNPNVSFQQQPRRYQQRQSVQYNNQGNQNQVYTYGKPYARNSSMPTGRQAYQVPTVVNGSSSSAASPSASSSSASTSSTATTTSTSTGSGSAAASGEFKGY